MDARAGGAAAARALASGRRRSPRTSANTTARSGSRARSSQAAGELGLAGGIVPPEYGGAGLDHVTYAMTMEEISRYCHVVACALTFPSGLVGNSILRYGTEEQKQRYLTPLARGEHFGGAGVTEARSGTDVSDMDTQARRDGDGLRDRRRQDVDQLPRRRELLPHLRAPRGRRGDRPQADLRLPDRRRREGRLRPPPEEQVRLPPARDGRARARGRARPAGGAPRGGGARASRSR